jgi:hypothetical protein
MMINYQTKNSNISSRRMKSNDYFYKYIMNPVVRGSTAGRNHQTKYGHFIPFNASVKPSIDERRREYLGKLDNEDYIKSDPELQARLGIRDQYKEV